MASTMTGPPPVVRAPTDLPVHGRVMRRSGVAEDAPTLGSHPRHLRISLSATGTVSTSALRLPCVPELPGLSSRPLDVGGRPSRPHHDGPSLHIVIAFADGACHQPAARRSRLRGGSFVPCADVEQLRNLCPGAWARVAPGRRFTTWTVRTQGDERAVGEHPTGPLTFCHEARGSPSDRRERSPVPPDRDAGLAEPSDGCGPSRRPPLTLGRRRAQPSSPRPNCVTFARA